MILSVFTITIFLTLIAGVLSKKLVKSTKDFFVGGGNLGTVGTTSMLMGAIIGGASTVGTSQLAYERGVGAVWFTVGLSISSILIYFVYGKLVLTKPYMTVAQIIGHNFGEKARKTASVILCLGMFIHINGQVLASVSIFNGLLALRIEIATLIVCILITAYVIFGGFWGGTVVGGIKTVLLYSTSIICGGYLIYQYHFLLTAPDSFTFHPWFDLFSEGVLKDLSRPVSTILGVLSTQIYFQTAMASKDKKVLRNTCVLTSLLILPIGMVCTMIGMYMHVHYPGIVPRDAFTLFVTNMTHPVIAGLSIASVLISSLATGAGLILGITTILSKDIIKTDQRFQSETQSLRLIRIIIVALVSVIYFIVITNANSLILNWGFLSMVFRATPVFVPVIIALYFEHIIIQKHEALYVLIGPALSILWILAGLDGVSSIYIGILGALCFAVLRYKLKKDTPLTNL